MKVIWQLSLLYSFTSHRRLKIILWFLLFFLIQPLKTQGQNVAETILIDSTITDTPLSLGNGVSYWLDKSGHANQVDALQVTNWQTLPEGIKLPSGKAIWLRFRLANSSSVDTIVLTFGAFDHIDLYPNSGAEAYHAGLLTDFPRRKNGGIPDPLAIAMLLQRQGEQEFLVRLQNEIRDYDNKVIPIVYLVVQHQHFWLQHQVATRSFDRWFAFFLGGIFVFFVYSLSQLIMQSRHERALVGEQNIPGQKSTAKAYLFYSGYLLGVFLYYVRLAEAGNSFQVLFAYKMSWYYYFESPIGLLCIFFYIQFLHAFLDLENRNETLSKLFLWSSYLVLLGLPLGLIVENALDLKISYVFYFWIRLVGAAIAFLTVLKVINIRDLFVRLVIIGSLILTCTGLASILWFYYASGKDFGTFNEILFFHRRVLGRLPILPMQIGIFVEVVFYAWALSLLTKKVLDKHQIALSDLREKDRESKLNLATALAKEKIYENITHEFRTPLTVILGLKDRLQENIQSGHTDQSQKDLIIVERNARQLLHLVNRILDFAKVKSGELKIKWIHGDILPYLKLIKESFQSLADSKQLHLRWEVADLHLQSISMDYDEDKIRDILSNLLSNAIKFTDPGGEVTLWVQKSADLLLLKVKDSGKGIPESDLPLIFDRYFQVADQSGTHIQGAGIGLALTKELVELLGGNISVQSVLGKGSDFTVALPIYHKAAEKSPVLDATDHQIRINTEISPVSPNPDLPVQALPVPPPSTEYTILLIEDNPDVAYYLKTCLEKDYHLLEAGNGQVGIDQVFKELPDLIITDVMMPEKDGYEVCNTLKNDLRSSHIPIIMLTALAETESRLHGLRLGADAYLAKPFDKEELLIDAGKLIGLRRTLQQKYGSQSDPIQAQAPKPDFLLHVDHCIKKMLDKGEWKIDYLCRAIGMGRSTLERRLKELAQTSIGEYIEDYRLHLAKRLLEEGRLNVTQVALEVAYDNLPTFSRRYKEKFGTPPMTHLKG